MSNDRRVDIGEVPLLTFNSLYNLLREEKKMRSLQRLPEGFYDSLNNFFKQKEEEVKRLKTDTSQKEKLKRERNVLANAERIKKELLALRYTKLANISIKNSVFGEEIIGMENVLNKENDFLLEVSKVVEKFGGFKR